MSAKYDEMGRLIPAMSGRHSSRHIGDYHATDMHSADTAKKAYTDLLREHGFNKDYAEHTAESAAQKTQESLGRTHADGAKPRGNIGRPARDVDLITPWPWSDRARNEGGT